MFPCKLYLFENINQCKESSLFVSVVKFLACIINVSGEFQQRSWLR